MGESSIPWDESGTVIVASQGAKAGPTPDGKGYKRIGKSVFNDVGVHNMST